MQYTPNYELPLYEPSDIANYLETYNNTITEIDNAIHEVQLKAEYGGTQGAEMQKEIESLNTRVATLESSLSTTIANVTAMSTTVSGHTTEIAKLKEDLLAQNTAVKSLSNTLAELSTQFSTFKTAQENFNADISARVGNRYFKAYHYAIGTTTGDVRYNTDFKVETGLANNDAFTKSHVLLEFMQTEQLTQIAVGILNIDFTTSGKTVLLDTDNGSFRIMVNFEPLTGDISIAIGGPKKTNNGDLYVNTTIYTD